MKTRMIIRREKGAAAIEFAIVLPVLLLLLFGIIEFSVLLYDKAMITNASREGARAGIVFTDDSTPRLTQAQIVAIVNSYCAAHLITFGDGSSLSTVTDPADTSGVSSGDPLTVTVTYVYDFLVLPNFMGGALSDLATLVAETVMMYE